MEKDIENSLRKIAHGASILVVGSFMSKAIMYFYRLMVGRELGTAQYGLLTLGLAVFGMAVTVSTLGFGNGVQRKISDYLGKEKDEALINSVIWSSLTTTVPFSLLIGAIMFFGADFFSTVFFDDPGAAKVLRIFGLVLPFHILYDNFENILKAFREMKYVTYVDHLFRSVLTVGVTALLLYNGYELMGALIAQLVAVILSSILIIYFVQYRVFPVFSKKTKNMKEERLKLAKYSFPLFLSGVVGLVMSWSDTILLGVFQESSAVGVYNAAYPTAQMLTLVSGGLSTMLFPTVSEYYGAGKKEKSLDLASAALKWNFATIFPGMIVMIIFAQPLLLLLFGEAYTGGAAALSILGVSIFIGAMAAHVGTFIKSEDRTKIPFYNSVGIAVLNIILNLALIPIYSGTGAALATAGASTVGAVLGILEVKYLLDIEVYQFRDYIPPFAATALSGIIVYTALQLMFETVPMLAVIPGGIAFGGIYGFFYLLFGGLDERDILVLHEMDEKTGVELEPIKKWVRKIAR